MSENDETSKSRKRAGAFWGRVLCALGILLAVIGAFFVSMTIIVLYVAAALVSLFLGPYALPGSYNELVNGIKEVI